MSRSSPLTLCNKIECRPPTPCIGSRWPLPDPWWKSDPKANGVVLYSVQIIFGSAMAASIVLGINAIRRRDVVVHGAWMMREYAIGHGARTPVLTPFEWLRMVG